MGLRNLRRGPLVPDGGYEEEEREADILEQVDRILKGLPPTEPTGILEQIDRIRRGLPREVPTGILAEADRTIEEMEYYGERLPWDGIPFGPIPADKVTIPVPWRYRIVVRRTGGVPSVTPAMLAMARVRGWEIEGTTARAHEGATLSGLSEAITHNRNDWRLIGFRGDPRTLQIGERVDLTMLLKKAADQGGPKTPETPTTAKMEVARGVWPSQAVPGFIEHKGAWKYEVRTKLIIVGEGDTLWGIAKDLRGRGSNYRTIFPVESWQGVTYPGQMIPLRMIQGIYRAWTKKYGKRL